MNTNPGSRPSADARTGAAPRPHSGRGGGGCQGGPPQALGGPPPQKVARTFWNNAPCEFLYMRGFPLEMDERMFRAIIAPYGNIVACRVLPPPPCMERAAAIAQMGSLGEAKWIVDNLNGNIPEGQRLPIEVMFSANAGLSLNKHAHRSAPY